MSTYEISIKTPDGKLYPAPGFRFAPTDAEMSVCLKRLVRHGHLSVLIPNVNAMSEAVTSLYDPKVWRDNRFGDFRYVWYQLRRNGSIVFRSTSEGFWKVSSTPKTMHGIVAKNLVYYYGGSRVNKMTRYHMIEYSVDGSDYCIAKLFVTGLNKSTIASIINTPFAPSDNCRPKEMDIPDDDDEVYHSDDSSDVPTTLTLSCAALKYF